MFFGLLALLMAVAPGLPQAQPAAPVPVSSSVPASPAAPPPLALVVDRTTRLLVVGPHPDDEALGAAGLIQRVRAHGGTVRVVMMTSGDGFPEAVQVAEKIAHPTPSDYRNFGVLREGETRAAMRRLGVPADHVTFFGYPDEGLCHLASTYLFDKKRSFQSPYSERSTPPALEQLVRGVAYRGVDIRRELETVVAAFAPTLIVLPHPEDDHPDHCSTHIFVREALNAVPAVVAQRVRVLHYLIHYQQWPLSPDAGNGATLRPPAGFPANEGRFVTLALTPAEAAAKREALQLYPSQMQMIGRFMTGFARDNELFIEGDPKSPPECWCDGANVATEAAMGSYRRKPPRQ